MALLPNMKFESPLQIQAMTRPQTRIYSRSSFKFTILTCQSGHVISVQPQNSRPEHLQKSWSFAGRYFVPFVQVHLIRRHSQTVKFPIRHEIGIRFVSPSAAISTAYYGDSVSCQCFVAHISWPRSQLLPENSCGKYSPFCRHRWRYKGCTYLQSKCILRNGLLIRIFYSLGCLQRCEIPHR